jgi:hypothetical protein
MGICYECSTKNGDSSLKKVSCCEACKKWFCEEHLKPKFPYFADWETVFDVQGNPRIKAMFYAEYGRKDGHPDLAYLREVINAEEIEEKQRNELIKQAIDKMEEADRERRTKRWEEEAKEKEAQEVEEEKLRANGQATTTENKYGFRFVVPLEVYSNAEYREYLNHAQTMKSVKVIVDEYYRKYGKKKKHWWQS